MKLYEFPSGDTVHKYKKSIVISFKGKRNVLSTGPNNGGFTTDLSAVFNNDANPGDGMMCFAARHSAFLRSHFIR